MGVGSTALSYPYSSVSASARFLPSALTAAGNSGVWQRVEEEGGVATLGWSGGMGLAYSFTGMTLPGQGGR